MGQYHLVVNLTKREFVNPHVLGCGLKQWEQVTSSPGTPAALFMLLCGADARGGGDITVPGSDVVGRWRGNRIAVVGDYTENGDIKGVPYLGCIYALCHPPADIRLRINESEGKSKEELRLAFEKYGAFADISNEVARGLEHVFEGRFIGDGWRNFVSNEDFENPPADMSPRIRKEIEAAKAVVAG